MPATIHYINKITDKVENIADGDILMINSHDLDKYRNEDIYVWDGINNKVVALNHEIDYGVIPREFELGTRIKDPLHYFEVLPHNEEYLFADWKKLIKTLGVSPYHDKSFPQFKYLIVGGRYVISESLADKADYYEVCYIDACSSMSNKSQVKEDPYICNVRFIE